MLGSLGQKMLLHLHLLHPGAYGLLWVTIDVRLNQNRSLPDCLFNLGTETCRDGINMIFHNDYISVCKLLWISNYVVEI